MSELRWKAVILLALLWGAPGCVTAGLWEGVGDANEPSSPGRLQRARLDGTRLELIVGYGERGNYLVRADLSAPTRGFWRTRPVIQAEVIEAREADLAGPLLPLHDGGPELESEKREPEASSAPGPDRAGGERAPEAPPPNLLVYGASGEDGRTSILCLLREGQPALYLEVPTLPPPGVARLAYPGAVLATPVTFAVDVVTFPVQAIIFIVVLDNLTDICK